MSRAYTYGSDLISQRQLISNQWSVRYYGYDGHGSVRFLTDQSGSVTDTYTYDAFGTLIGRTGATPNEYLYAGERIDAETGMYYLRARYMQPNTGRFWTMDSYEGSSYDPVSLHKYTYANADPSNMVDPSGRFSTGELMTALSVASILTNISLALFHGYKAATATTQEERDREAFAAAMNTLGAFMGLFGGGFIGPGSSLATAGGGTIAVAVVTRANWIIGSLVIPAAQTIVMMSSVPGGGGSGGGGGGGGSGSNVRIGDDNHVNVPKHNLDKLAPTWTEQKQMILDAVTRMVKIAPRGAPAPNGSFIEGTTAIQNARGELVTTTVRWFEYNSGEVVVSTAFCP